MSGKRFSFNVGRGTAAIKDFVSIYPGALEAATVDGMAVTAQPGDFYGGWSTAEIVGPVKGGPGTMGW